MSRRLFLAFSATLLLGGCSTDTFGEDAGGGDGSPGSDAADAGGDVISITDGPSGGDGAFSCPFSGTPIKPAGCTSACSSGCCINPDAGTAVCATAGQCVSTGGDTNLWQCFQPNDCSPSGSMYCCFDHAVKSLFQCPHTIDPPVTTSCSSSSTCFRLCAREVDCAGTAIQTHCSKVDFGGAVEVGVCL